MQQESLASVPTPKRFGPGFAGPHRVAPFEGVARSAAGVIHFSTDVQRGTAWPA